MFAQNNGYSLSDIAAITGNNRNNDDGWGGNGCWWIILLFLFAFNGGWGNGGWGNGGAGSGMATYGLDLSGLNAGYRDTLGTRQELANGFYDLNTNLLTGFANTNAAICQGNNNIVATNNANTNTLMAANTANTNTINSQLQAMQAQQAQCCCDQKKLISQNFAELNYNLASQACENRQVTQTAARDIIDAQNNGTKAILDFLVQNKLDELQSENASLRGQISQAEQNAYLVNALGAKVPQAAYIVANPYTGTAYSSYGCGATSVCGCSSLA